MVMIMFNLRFEFKSVGCLGRLKEILTRSCG